MGFVIPADLDDLVVDFLGGAPARQDVLRTDEFDCLGHHGGRAQIHQPVAEISDGGVGAEAAGSVAAAALDAQHQIGDVTGLPGYPGGVRHHLAGHADRLFDGFERAALLLDAEGDDGLVGDLENALPQLTVRDVFTAQADDYDAVDVGVGGKAH